MESNLASHRDMSKRIHESVEHLDSKAPRHFITPYRILKAGTLKHPHASLAWCAGNVNGSPLNIAPVGVKESILLSVEGNASASSRVIR